jgi:hypothetical protein
MSDKLGVFLPDEAVAVVRKILRDSLGVSLGLSSARAQVVHRVPQCEAFVPFGC